MSIANNDFNTAALIGGSCKYNSRIFAILSSLLSMSRSKIGLVKPIPITAVDRLTCRLNKIIVQLVGEDWLGQITQNLLQQFTADVCVGGRINATNIGQATRGKHLRQIVDLVRVASDSENTLDVIA